MDEKLEQARRRWRAQKDDASEREYHVALERAGWPWETAHLQRVGGWRLERVLCGYTVGANLRQAAAFSRDGRRLVTSDATRLRVWDATTRRRVHGGGPIAEETDLLSLSPDGESVLFVPGRWRAMSPAELWRLDPWERVAIFDIDGAACHDATHLADGRIVTMHGDGVARVWSDGAVVREAVHGEPPHAWGRGRVVARPGGGFVTIVGGDPRPTLWTAVDARARRCRRPEQIATSAQGPDLAVSHHDRYVAASWGDGGDGGVALFDLTTLEVVAEKCDRYGKLAFSHDAVVVGTGNVFDVLRLPDLSDRETCFDGIEGHGLAASPDGRLACVGGALFDTTSWREVAPPIQRGRALQVGFTPGTPRIASASLAALNVWDRETGSLERSFPMPAGWTRTATLESPALGALIPGHDVARRIDLRTFESRAISGLTSTSMLVFQPGGSLVAEQTRSGVAIVDLRDGSSGWRWDDPDAPLGCLWRTCAAFSADGRRVFVTGHEGIVALDVERGDVVHRAPWPPDAPPRSGPSGGLVRTLAASHTLLAAIVDTHLVTFDASTCAARDVVTLDAPVDAVRFGARDDVLFLQDDRGWRAVDARTGRPVATPPPEPACPVDFRLPAEAEERASALAVSEDGQRLLMGTNAGGILLFSRR